MGPLPEMRRDSLQVTVLPDDRAAHEETKTTDAHDTAKKTIRHIPRIKTGWLMGEMGEVYTRARRLSSNMSGDFEAPEIARLPTIDELAAELSLSTAELNHCKREFYQRKFRLWMPMVHEFDEDDEGDGEVEEVELLPIDEVTCRSSCPFIL